MAITSRVTKKISSPVTKRNPRPRKYASQADRQAAYRARNIMLEFRAEPKTADNITRIADTLGYPRSDVLLSMVKFALTNHDWARFGLTHKTIPTYKENPTMKPASPAQLAARKRFAEMARSGAFKKATKRKANPATIQYIVFSELSPQKYKQMLVTENKQRAISVANVNQMDGYHSVVEDQVGHLIYDAKTRQGYLQSNPSKRKANPTKSEKTWQRYETYDGESNVIKAIIDGAEVLIFPIKKSEIEFYDMPEWTKVIVEVVADEKHTHVQFPAGSIAEGKDNVKGFVAAAKKYKQEEKGQRKTNPAKKTVSQKVSQLVHEGYPQRQAVAVALSEQRAGKVKRNPGKVKYRNLAIDLKGDQRVGYSVHIADRPSYQAIAWFSKKADAMKVAQEAADRTGKQLAVTRVQNYFGAM